MPKFITNQNIEIELEIASLGDRIVAFILDSLIKVAYIILFFLVLGIGAGSDTAMAFFLLLMIPVFLYSLLFEWLGNGQTPGKKARGIQVVKLDGSSPTFAGYLLRWMFRLVDMYLFNAIVGVVCIIASKNGQRIGDMVAGTTVIKTRVSGSIRAFQVSESDHKVTFPMAKMLSDEQIDLMKKAIKMHGNNPDNEVIAQLAVKLKEKLGTQTVLEDLEFLKTVIRDYEFQMNHE